jgi:acetamidase/formamidase
MPKTIISVDPKKAPWDQATPLHNRWHPDIPPVASVKEGEAFRVSIALSMRLMCSCNHAKAPIF